MTGKMSAASVLKDGLLRRRLLVGYQARPLEGGPLLLLLLTGVWRRWQGHWQAAAAWNLSAPA